MSNPNDQKQIKIQPAKDYEKMIQLQLRYLPQQLQAELLNRAQYDPAFIEQALGIQHKYDPALAQEQRDALIRRDPQWVALHEGLGDKIKQALDRGYVDPRQEAAYDKWSKLAGTVDPRYEAAYSKLAGLAGEVDPEQAAAYHRAAALAGKVDPRFEKAYGALGAQVTGDTLRGGTASPDTLRQMTQAIMSRTPSLSYGEAQDMASAVYTGQRSEALKAQRQGATNQFLQQRDPMTLRQQSLEHFYGMPSLTQQRQQSLGQFSQLIDPTRMQQQSLGQFYGAQAPEMQAYGLAGTFIQPSNSIVNAENQIGGVQAPSAFRYVNPFAGQQGLQLGLQNQQAQLANQGLSGGGGNPWTNALAGAGAGASMGSVGGGYGMAGGALTGAIAGAFGYPQYSDIAGKEKLSRTGLETPDGIPIVEFNYRGQKTRYRGVIAQDVAKKRPDAVYHFGDGRLGVFYSRLGLELKEI